MGLEEVSYCREFIPDSSVTASLCWPAVPGTLNLGTGFFKLFFLSIFHPRHTAVHSLESLAEQHGKYNWHPGMRVE